jgi:hypothetical protein
MKWSMKTENSPWKLLTMKPNEGKNLIHNDIYLLKSSNFELYQSVPDWLDFEIKFVGFLLVGVLVNSDMVTLK